jgi:formate dehydrogenase maturation protein FdhE
MEVSILVEQNIINNGIEETEEVITIERIKHCPFCGKKTIKGGNKNGRRSNKSNTGFYNWMDNRRYNFPCA